MSVLRHKISSNTIIQMSNGDVLEQQVEKTCCGIELNLVSFPISATYVGEYNCEDCEAGYALELLAELP